MNNRRNLSGKERELAVKSLLVKLAEERGAYFSWKYGSVWMADVEPNPPAPSEVVKSFERQVISSGFPHWEIQAEATPVGHIGNRVKRKFTIEIALYKGRGPFTLIDSKKARLEQLGYSYEEALSDSGFWAKTWESTEAITGELKKLLEALPPAWEVK